MKAGSVFRPGQCLTIATGAAVPAGADAVLPMEDSLHDPARGVISGLTGRQPQAGRHVRTAGEELRKGEQLLPAGTVVTPAVVCGHAPWGAAWAADAVRFLGFPWDTHIGC
jgi:molybdopterin molybdotransferase